MIDKELWGEGDFHAWDRQPLKPTPDAPRAVFMVNDRPWPETIARPAASARAREAADLIEQYPKRREPGPVRAELVEPVPGEAVAAALDLRGGRGKVPE